MSSVAAPPESTRAAPGLPSLGNGKGNIATPIVSEDGNMESKSMGGSSSQDKLPLHEDIMQLARLGEIGPIQNLFEEGKYTANYEDEEGITSLHVGDVQHLETGPF